ncbi:hypothetical protein SAMN05421858_3580 [Haladaptatus litoreus]|uniref:Heparinase II/III-like protein n=1 Tax=Haladaptatus litoreus TaxID=553468 RepID=A0A1N7DFF7_9EURY|nr:hypothetical protein [Haladaptatus litoreus]SIR74556.1 hypothetical protein SAMN05421858_3580 [Haladaptatus litoreus]
MVVSKQKYIDAIESGLTVLRQPHLSEFWAGEYRDDEWGGRHRIIQDFALIYAVLYEHTGEEEYRELATKHLLDFGQGDHFASILCGTAYELLADDLTPTERSTFGSEWVSEAEKSLEMYVSDPNDIQTWDQVPNHAIGACFYADYASHLFPEESLKYDYQQYTDAVWETWWKRREFHEQASNYEGFAETFLSKWAKIRGKADAFYRTPSVVNMLERNLKAVTPSGIVTPYGDSGYHQHQCKWIALFERVAFDTDDGRFQDAADDIFSYFQDHVFDRFLDTVDSLPESESLYNGRLIFKNHLHELAWLGLAALWHDPTIESKSRPVPAGRLRRLPYGYLLDEADKRLLPNEKMTDGQVALTGGNPESSEHTYLLLSVGPKLVHDHADASAIQMLSRDATTLLGTNGYLQRELLYHNVFYAQPSDWSQYPADDPERIISGEENCRGTIEQFRIDEHSSQCRVTFENFHGMPIRLTREVLMNADGTVTLLDRVLPHEDGYCGGPLFHAESIKERSDGAYKLRTEHLRSLGNIVSRNSPGNLVVDPSYPEESIDVVQPNLPPIYEESYNEFPTTEYKQVWKRSYATRNCLASKHEFEAGEEVVFETRLTPEL